MKSLSPRNTIILGGCLAVGGVLIALIVPTLFYPVVSTQLPPDQDILVLVSTIVSVLQFVLVPFGAALVGAGIVMRYLEERLPQLAAVPVDQSDVEA